MARSGFDTLQTAREFEHAGMERPHAEAIARAIGKHGEGAVMDALAALRGEIRKAAFSTAGITVAAIAVATGTLLSRLA